MPGTHERSALLSALLAVALWSTVATGFKLGLEVLAPAQLLFLGACVSSMVFSAAWLKQGRPTRGLTLRESLLLGLMNPTLYYLVLFEAYDRLPAQIAQPLNYTWAITLAILSVPVLGQRLTGRTLAGIGISYAGVVVLLSRGQFDRLPDLDMLGVALALLSTLLWAAYWLLNARTRTPPVALMAASFLLATPVLALICWLGPGLPSLTLETATYGAWVGLVEMGVTFLLWQRALRLTASAARIGQLIFLSPFVSLMLISTVLGEQIYPSSWLGLGVIVIGLIVTGARDNRTSDPTG